MSTDLLYIQISVIIFKCFKKLLGKLFYSAIVSYTYRYMFQTLNYGINDKIVYFTFKNKYKYVGYFVLLFCRLSWWGLRQYLTLYCYFAGCLWAQTWCLTLVRCSLVVYPSSSSTSRITPPSRPTTGLLLTTSRSNLPAHPPARCWTSTLGGTN